MKHIGKWLVLGVTMGLILSGCGENKEQASTTGTSVTTTEKAAENEQETTFFFVRHGKTMFNTTDQVQGWSDTPLTEVGVKGAVELGESLKGTTFTAAYSSDLGRAVSTAEHILTHSGNQQLEVNKLSGLREWGYGGYEGRDNSTMWTPIFKEQGLTFDAEWSQYSKLVEKMSDEDIANAIAKNDETKTAETYAEIVSRTTEALEQMKKETASEGGNVLVVSHGSEIPTILEILAPGSYQGEDITNCSVTRVVYSQGNYSVVSIGEEK